MIRKKIELVLSLLTVTFAFFSWHGVDQIVRAGGNGTWIGPMILFMFFLVCICLDIVLFEDVVFLELLLVGSLLIGVVFTFSLWHLLGAIVGGYFLFLAARRIRRDLELNIKIDLLKSLRTGKAMLVLAISLVISLQYFSVISQLKGQILIPRIELGSTSSKVAFSVLSAIDPTFKSLENENITVDEFILKNQESQRLAQNQQGFDFDTAQIVEQELDQQNIPLENREQLRLQVGNKLNNLNSQLTKEEQVLILQHSRGQLSALIGRDVQGSENVSTVISELISKKIESIFAPSVAGQQGSSSVAGVLAGILFFTVLSICSLLSIVFFGLSIGIFSLLVRFGFVAIKTVTVEKEMIA